MTTLEHKKMLAGSFFLIGALKALFWVLSGGLAGGEWFALMIALFLMLAGWKMQNDKSGADAFGIIASIICLPNFLIGTVIGIYGLWYFILGREND